MPVVISRTRIVAVGLAYVVAAAAGTRGDDVAGLFEREIRPYLAERCYGCHSTSGKREDGLALDWSGGIREGGFSGPAVVPGKPEESLLLKALRQEEDLPMPKGGPKPSAEVVASFTRWIAAGAPDPRTKPPSAEELARETSWEAVFARRKAWWSLQPITRPAVPAGGPHPIDAFIQAGLAAQGLTPSPSADRATLLRRLSFDLVGLPPTPEEIDAFVADTSPDAYEKVVDRLLASPRYGERWGRHWLDVVRYTESQGFEYDRPRNNAWHYRDYCISSFNDDLPYDVFMRQQLAGDVLEPVTRDGIVATSMLVCGAWDQAGNSQKNATQRAITREEEMEDLVSVVGQSFLGLTLNCARCHTHKFDPISQQEYFQIKAVFDGVKHGERPIATPDEARAHETRIKELSATLAAAQATMARIEAAGTLLARNQIATAAARPTQPTPLVEFSFAAATAVATAGRLEGDAEIVDGRLVLPVRSQSYFQSGPLPVDVGEKTLEACVRLANLQQRGGAVISIESDDRDFDAIVFGEREPGKWVAGSMFFRRTRDLDAAAETAAATEDVHVAAVYRADGSVTMFRNGQPYGKPYTPNSPLRTYKAGATRVLLGLRHHGAGKGFLAGEIRRAALHDRALSAEEIAALAQADGVVVPREAMLAALTPAQRAELDAAAAQAAAIRKEIRAVPPLAVSYAGVRKQPEPTRLLARGDVTQPGDPVTARGLAAIETLPADFGLTPESPEAARRIAFASWVSDPRNPLPARVMANRVWQLHFGQGLVPTPNDFGATGSRPTHPELLDWLASEFIAGGWSVKALHRLIVSSATYRQSAASRPDCVAKDADNTLLWRYAPRRLEAEPLRDAMLAVSGQLNLAIGGPSFRPFTTSKHGATFYHLVDKPDPEFNRRTVYRMNINSGKEPLLHAFDCPDPSVKTPRRGVTITPLQALSLMNNSFVQRQATGLAARAAAAAPDDPAAAVITAYRLTLGRRPTPEELSRATAAARDRGLPAVCWVLLNSTEFVYVR